MSELFLRAVELSNFRIYGDSYAFELPDEPAITIITGANGLGKTSFFDGVEWALTGQVSRFSDIHVDGRRRGADPLTRIGAPEASHRVSLAFTNAPPIDRGNGFLPDERAIAELLKVPNWPEIGQLHGYLSITHFLGQASTRRFSLREPKAQWEALKGPAGVDRINALRERVSGQGARQAFTRAIRERSQSLEKAGGALESWQSLIAARDRLGLLASSDRSVTPLQVREDVDRLARQLLAHMPGHAWIGVGAAEEPETALNRLASLIEVSSQRSNEESALCEELDQILIDFNDAGARAAANVALVQEVSARRSRQVEALTSSEVRVSQAASTHARTEQAAAQIQARASALALVARAMERFDRGKAEIAEIDQQLNRSRVASEQATAQLEEVQAKLTALQTKRAERSRLARRQLEAEQRSRISYRLAMVRNEMTRLSTLAAGTEATALRSMRGSLSEALNRVGAEISKIEDGLRRHDDRARSLAEAVSLIAHQLSHEDQSCPVCATPFEPGRLKELAEAQASSEFTSASDLAAELISAKTRNEDVARRVAELDRRIVEHDQLMATLASEQAQEAHLVRQLVEAGGSPDKTYDDADALALAALVNQADVDLGAQPGEEVLRALVHEAQASFEAERVKRTSLEQRRSGALSDVESARSLLGQHSELWSSASGLLINLYEAQASVERDARAIGDQLTSEATALDAARIERDALVENISRQDANLVQARREAEALAEQRRKLIDRWHGAGQAGEPDRTWISQLRLQIAERQQRERPIAHSHSELIEGLRRWQNDQQLQERENALRAGMEQRGKSSVEEVTALLKRELGAAQIALDVAQRARVRMEEIGSRMQVRAERFADEVLKPLNDTIQRFARPLMTWTDASIIYRAEHYATRSELRTAIVRAAADGSMMPLEMNPNLYFSEGQLSALSVSALLAASTTFTWSKWRGLLLDDPLQHNDVIHASAFMDLLRQMVRELRYQVILSTHDSAEAEFLVRKCRSAGIPYALHELVPHGDDGLVSVAA